MDRYDGKPFLRLLECYVLDAIGQLDGEQRAALQAMEPKLGKTCGMSGSWREIVAGQMDFPDTLPPKIRAFWDGYAEDARGKGVAPDPNAFAASFVDQNFVD